MDYAVFELGSRQYKISPGQTIEVDRLPDNTKQIAIDKVLLISEEGQIEIGKPYLKKPLNLEVVANVRHKKIRVVTYKAKSNERRIKGQRRQATLVKLA